MLVFLFQFFFSIFFQSVHGERKKSRFMRLVLLASLDLDVAVLEPLRVIGIIGGVGAPADLLGLRMEKHQSGRSLWVKAHEFFLFA